MNKITSVLIVSLLLIGAQTTFAQSADNTAVKYNSTVKEYDFENNSYNISDEQLQADSAEESLQKDRKASFWDKIINSSHFSSNTATRTWIPFNKQQ